MDDVTARRIPLNRVITPTWERGDQAEVAPKPPYQPLKNFMFGFFVVLCMAAVAWPMLPRRFDATATVVLRPTDREGQSDAAQAMRQPLDEAAIQSEVDVIGATEILDAVIRKHQLALDPEFSGGPGLLSKALAAIPGTSHLVQPPSPERREMALRREVQSHMIVNRDRRSYTVRLGFWSEDPRKAAAMTETLIAAYLNEQVARKRAGVETLKALLDERVGLLRLKQESSEKALNDFLNQSGLIDRGAQLSLEAQLSTMSNEAAAARARAIDVSTRARNLAAMQKAGTLDSAPEVLSSTTIQRLKDLLSAAMARPAVMPSEYKALTDQINLETGRIVRSVEAEAQNWIKREAMLQDEIKTIRSALIQRQQAENQIERLRREAANDRTVLDEALTRLKGQTAMASGIRPDAEVIVSSEVPAKPAFPNLPLYALGSLIAAALAGAAMNWRALYANARRLLAA